MHKTMIKERLTCRKVEEFLMAYLDRELGLFSHLRFRMHILMCSNCKKYMQEYKNTVELGKEFFDRPEQLASGKVPEQILEAIININT